MKRPLVIFGALLALNVSNIILMLKANQLRREALRIDHRVDRKIEAWQRDVEAFKRCP